jgi:hypothetical protein
MSSPHNTSTATRIVSYLATEQVNGAAAAPKGAEILDQRAEQLAGLHSCLEQIAPQVQNLGMRRHGLRSPTISCPP